MKIFNTALLVILLAGGVAAQTSSDTQGAPDVTVMKISWRRVSRNPMLDDRPIGNPESTLKMAVNRARINAAESARATGIQSPAPVLFEIQPEPTSPPPVRPWSGFVYEFTVKNTGPKIIRKLAFEYSFTDPVTKRTVGRRQYKSGVKILPGATAKVIVRSTLPPLGTVNAAQAGSQDGSPEQMVIQSIKYADGSVWRRSSK
jgi:hypothetical protein